MFLQVYNNVAFTWGWGNGLVQDVIRCQRFISFNLFYSLTMFINFALQSCERDSKESGGRIHTFTSSSRWKKNVQIEKREWMYRLFQKFVPIVNCILRKEFNASFGKCKLIQVGYLFK